MRGATRPRQRQRVVTKRGTARRARRRASSAIQLSPAGSTGSRWRADLHRSAPSELARTRGHARRARSPARNDHRDDDRRRARRQRHPRRRQPDAGVAVHLAGAVRRRAAEVERRLRAAALRLRRDGQGRGGLRHGREPEEAPACEAGRYSGSGQAACVACEEGRFAAAAGQTSCSLVSGGSYVATTGATRPRGACSGARARPRATSTRSAVY